MTNQSLFMDTLRSVAEIVRISGEPVQREDIKTYFKDMELTEAQEEMVYQYLLNPPVEEEPEAEEEPIVEEETTAEEQSDEEATTEKLSDSVFFQMYMEDLEELPKYSEEDKLDLYERLVSGDSGVISQLSDAWLLNVIEMAKAYIERPVNMEDVIQEGNIGLLLGLNSLLDFDGSSDVEQFLKDSIKQAMEDFIAESLEEEEIENTVIAKSNLIYEARKHLAEDLGHVPSTEELCKYTNMNAEEINEIISLAESGKAKR